ncbi:MAG: TolC family protein, partial [Bacteroidetes bacterium]
MCLSTSLSAQENFTLEAAIQYALEHNANIRTGQLDIADADQQIVENTATGLPRISAGLNYQNNIKLPTSLVPARFFDPNAGEDEFAKLQFGTNHNFSASLDLNWLALDGSYLVSLKAARMFRDLTEKNYHTTQKKVRNEVIQAYLPVLIISENLRILDKNIANLEKLRDETKAIFESGFAEQLDVDRLDLSLANLRVERENLVRQKETTLNYLKMTLGYPMDKPLYVADNLNGLFKEAAPETLAGPVRFEDRPEYLAALKGIELNEVNVTRFKMMYYPSLRVFGSYQRAWQGNQLGSMQSFPSFFVGGGLSIPIFDGLGKKALIQRANIGLEKARIQKSELERAILLEVQNARIAYQNAKN